MLWQKKKKRKKATKSKAVTQTAPHQPAEELPQTTEPEKKKKRQSKKARWEKCKKVLSPEKAFLDAFGRLTNRHRAWDVWRDFIIMFACSLSNPLDKEHRDKREALYLEVIKSTISRIKSCFLNWLRRRSWLWRKIRSKIFWAAFLCLSISATSIMDRSLRRIMSVS